MRGKNDRTLLTELLKEDKTPKASQRDGGLGWERERSRGKR